MIVNSDIFNNYVNSNIFNKYVGRDRIIEDPYTDNHCCLGELDIFLQKNSLNIEGGEDDVVMAISNNTYARRTPRYIEVQAVEVKEKVTHTADVAKQRSEAIYCSK